MQDCAHFDFGDGTCPFGTSCFYRHAYRDGRLEVRRRKILFIALHLRRDYKWLMTDAVCLRHVSLNIVGSSAPGSMNNNHHWQAICISVDTSSSSTPCVAAPLWLMHCIP